MTNLYRSAKGKMIDIDKVKIRQENVASVGNMNTNARGDLLGNGQQVALGRNALMDQIYSVPDAPYSPNDPAVHQQQQAAIAANKAQQLDNIANNLAVEPTAESAASATPAVRGNLAGTVAKK